MPTASFTLRKPQPRHSAPPVNPFYGYHYNPAWPSILSVAHDEDDGAVLYVVLDRPCELSSGWPPVVPLVVEVGGYALEIVSVEMVLPVKLRVVLREAVPLRAAWRWMGGECAVSDPITGAYPNAGAGDCADFPGPYTPPPANVVSVTGPALGSEVAMLFDRAVNIIPGVPVASGMQFGGQSPVAVWPIDARTLGIRIAVPIEPNVTQWSIDNQPDWIETALTWPTWGVIS